LGGCSGGGGGGGGGGEALLQRLVGHAQVVGWATSAAKGNGDVGMRVVTMRIFAYYVFRFSL
jgi:hypothetical protein